MAPEMRPVNSTPDQNETAQRCRRHRRQTKPDHEFTVGVTDDRRQQLKGAGHTDQAGDRDGDHRVVGGAQHQYNRNRPAEANETAQKTGEHDRRGGGRQGTN